MPRSDCKKWRNALTSSFNSANCAASIGTMRFLPHRVSTAGGALRQDFADDVAVDVGQPALDAVVVDAQPLVVEAEEVQNGRVEVVDCRDVFDCLVAELVGRTVAEWDFDAGAGEPDGEALRVVVAALRAGL